jgi:hypothetical protein
MSMVITQDASYVAGTASSAFAAAGLQGATFGLWVKRTTPSRSDMYAEIGRAIGDEHDLIAIGDAGAATDGQCCFGGTQDRMNGMGSTNSTAWQLRVYVFTRNAVNVSYVGTVGGSLVAGNGNITMALASVSAIDEVRIGGAMTTLNGQSGWWCRAELAHAFFYNKALSQAEVQELFNGGAAGNGKNPTAVAAANLRFYAPLTSDASVNTGAVTLTASATAPTFSSGSNPPVDAVGGSDTTPPVITGPTGAAGAASISISVAENTTACGTWTATDATGPVVWSISGGADAARFSINSSTGALAFAVAPDFEAPTDVGGNNVYDVIVRCADAVTPTPNASTQSVAVTVTDVADTPGVLATSAIKLGAWVGSGAGLTFAYDVGVSYAAEVYADGTTLGNRVLNVSPASTAAGGLYPANISSLSLTGGTTYKVVFTNQTTSESSAPYRITAT